MHAPPQIAAPGQGSLGAVWIGVHPLPAPEQAVRAVLEVPAEVTPVGLVYVGHLAETPPPRTRHDPRRVHWQRYQPKKRRTRLKNAKYAG